MALWGKKSKPEADPVNVSSNGAAPPATVAREPLPPAAKAAPSQPSQTASSPSSPKEASTPPQSAPAGDAKARSAASDQLLLSFGKIVSVLMRDPQFRAVPLADMEALVVPAILTGQILLAEAQSKSNGFVSPVAVALWASVSKEIDERLSTQLDQPFRLSPKDWKSGDIAWLVGLAGDRRVAASMLKQLQDNTLKGRPLKMRGKSKDGKTVVGTFSSASDQPTPATS